MRWRRRLFIALLRAAPGGYRGPAPSPRRARRPFPLSRRSRSPKRWPPSQRSLHGGRHHGGPGGSRWSFRRAGASHSENHYCAARAAGLPMITATQMLESMVDSPTPTRARPGCGQRRAGRLDAVMLSAETASGAYPTLTAETMARIAQLAEEALPPGWQARRTPSCPAAPITLSRRLPASPNSGAPRQSSASQQRCHPAPTVPPSTPDAAHRPHRYRGDPPPFSAAQDCARPPRNPPWPGTLRRNARGASPA